MCRRYIIIIREKSELLQNRLNTNYLCALPIEKPTCDLDLLEQVLESDFGEKALYKSKLLLGQVKLITG